MLLQEKRICPGCGAELNGGGRFCRFCGAEVGDEKKYARPAHMIQVCPCCGADRIEGDSYCRFCGARVTEPQYVEYRSEPCVYGPMPRIRRHRCEKCGYAWETDVMIDNEMFCPKCGGKAPAKDK